MSNINELVQKILSSGYECEAGELKNDRSFLTLVQHCLTLEDALVREKLNRQPLLKRNES